MKFRNIKHLFNLLTIGIVASFITIIVLLFVIVDNVKTMSQLEIRVLMLEKTLINGQKQQSIDIFYPVSSTEYGEYDHNTYHRLGIIKNTLYSIDNTLKRINEKVGYLNDIDYPMNNSNPMAQEIGFYATVTDSDVQQYLKKQDKFQNELLRLMRGIKDDTSYIRFLR